MRKTKLFNPKTVAEFNWKGKLAFHFYDYKKALLFQHHCLYRHAERVYICINMA